MSSTIISIYGADLGLRKHLDFYSPQAPALSMDVAFMPVDSGTEPFHQQQCLTELDPFQRKSLRRLQELPSIGQSYKLKTFRAVGHGGTIEIILSRAVKY
jgi:hypothetical protein